MEMQTAGPLQARIIGQGPPVLLVHGYPLDHRMWDGQLEALGAEHQLLAPDLRGFGASAALPAGDVLTMAQHADDLAAMLDALQIAAPVTLAGLSMGGYIALEFWSRHRPRLGKLVLCDTKASADDEAGRQGREAAAQQALAAGAEAVAAAMLPRLLGSGTPPDGRAGRLARQMMLETAPATLAAAQRGMAARADFDSRLPDIDCPCLLLCGEEDQITPPAVMQALADGLPAAQLHRIAGAGHLAPLEQPDACNAVLSQWLRDN
jgi:pimeloyl-ACP methyl ester carboxylesterase